MSISIDRVKSIWQSLTIIPDYGGKNPSSKLRRELPHCDKDYPSLMTTGISKSGKQDASSLIPKTGQGCLLTWLLLQRCAEGFSQCNKEKGELKGIPVGKEDVKLFLWRWHDCHYGTSDEIKKNATRTECSNITN